MQIDEKALSFVQSIMEFIEAVLKSDSPMMINYGAVNIKTGEQFPAVSIWAGKVDDEGNPPSPIKRILELRQELDALKVKLKTATRWIPVEEALPTENGYYFTKVEESLPKNCKVIVTEFVNGTFYCECFEDAVKDVTHWRKID